MRSAMVAVLLAAAAPAMAAQVYSSGYDMPNGGGNASGGSFNYWDLFYSGSGMTNVDGAPLAGGAGDLTDGVVASDFWFNVENNAGTGPYVGWLRPGRNQADPTITFHFAGGTVINGINLHVDNSWVGGVHAPAAIWVDGVAQTYAAPAVGTIGWINLTGLNLFGGSHTVQLFQDFNAWAFVSEVTFDGSVVPEPATWALTIGGLALVGAAMRRRRTTVVYS